MKDEFSLESLKDQIYLNNTSSYFEEVYSCYIHGNYRSAVVMLWSVVVLDLVQKLEILEEVYEDKVATEILKNIEDLKRENSKSSLWELQMVETISKRTELIDFSEYTTLQYLQQQRHLSAHPVLEGLTKIYVPNKDTTRALIRNALEIVLLKSPVYTDKILEKIITDLADNKIELSNGKKLKKYIQHRYLERLNSDAKLKIFEIFWKFVMRLDNPECTENRVINRKFLTLLALDNLSAVEERIRNKSDFYSEIKNDKKFIRPLIIFLGSLPTIYPLLNPAIRIILDTRIEKDLELEVISFYTKSSMEEHYKHLKNVIANDMSKKNVAYGAWKLLYDATESEEMQKEFNNTLSLKYYKSKSMLEADRAAYNIIRFIDEFDVKSIENMLEEAEKNSKTYNRGDAYEDYQAIKRRVDQLQDGFDWERYPNFNKVTVALE